MTDPAQLKRLSELLEKDLRGVFPLTVLKNDNILFNQEGSVVAMSTSGSLAELFQRTSEVLPGLLFEDRTLRNLLARVHRDGGHFTEEHGFEKSVQVADERIASLNSQNDELLAALKRMVKMLDLLSPNVPWGKTWNTGVWLSELNEAPGQARAAIASAEATAAEATAAEAFNPETTQCVDCGTEVKLDRERCPRCLTKHVEV